MKLTKRDMKVMKDSPFKAQSMEHLVVSAMARDHEAHAYATYNLTADDFTSPMWRMVFESGATIKFPCAKYTSTTFIREQVGTILAARERREAYLLVNQALTELMNPECDTKGTLNWLKNILGAVL